MSSQQVHTFWFDDGDLVLSVLNPSTEPDPTLQSQLDLLALANEQQVALQHQQPTPVFFRLRAVRLVTTSEAFAQLLSPPPPARQPQPRKRAHELLRKSLRG